MWQKPGVSISPGLKLVQGRDRQTDRQTNRITIASMGLALKNDLVQSGNFLGAQSAQWRRKVQSVAEVRAANVKSSLWQSAVMSGQSLIVNYLCHKSYKKDDSIFCWTEQVILIH